MSNNLIDIAYFNKPGPLVVANGQRHLRFSRRLKKSKKTNKLKKTKKSKSKNNKINQRLL